MSENKTDFVQWSDALNVGIPFVDAQHRKLIDILNELHSGIHGAHGPQSPEGGASFRKAMHGAVEYVRVHFSAEEELLRKINYPDFAAHKAQHEEFVRHILDSVSRFESGNRYEGLELVKLLSFFRNWLLEHIGVLDKNYATYAKKNGFI